MPAFAAEAVREPAVEEGSNETKGLGGGGEEVDLVDGKAGEGFEPDGEVVERLGDDTVETVEVSDILLRGDEDGTERGRL